MRPKGWLISVHAPDDIQRPLYATVAKLSREWFCQVFNLHSLTNEVIRLERILAEAEIKRLGLQPGEVETVRHLIAYATRSCASPTCGPGVGVANQLSRAWQAHLHHKNTRMLNAAGAFNVWRRCGRSHKAANDGPRSGVSGPRC